MVEKIEKHNKKRIEKEKDEYLWYKNGSNKLNYESCIRIAILSSCCEIQSWSKYSSFLWILRFFPVMQTLKSPRWEIFWWGFWHGTKVLRRNVMSSYLPCEEKVKILSIENQLRYMILKSNKNILSMHISFWGVLITIHWLNNDYKQLWVRSISENHPTSSSTNR